MNDKLVKSSKSNSRSLAKTGMVASMATAIYSGFVRGKPARLIHPWAVLAMVGFTIWHHQLNTKPKRSRKV
jgi:hypothetical protein